MKSNPVVAAIVWLNAVLIGGFITWYVNSNYPTVGQDYRYFVPRLIDTYLHYKVNGLSIQWYTPSFGGGLPAYPNPQQIQFSVTQLLMVFVDPWAAILASIFLFGLAGFLGSYYFLKRQLGLQTAAALTGALVFGTSGFFIEHLAAGHLGYLGFTLLPCFLIGLLETRSSVWVRGNLLALLGAILVYSGGFYPAVFIALSILICLPLIYLLKPELFDWRKIGLTLTIGVLLTLGLSGSKLWAVDSFMRLFPRLASDHYDVSLRTAITGLLLQFAGTMTLAPIYWARGLNLVLLRNLLQAYTGGYVGYWELDISISPVLWALFICGGILTLVSVARRGLQRPSLKKWLTALLLIIAVEITLEFTFARGLFYPFLSELPILRSLHVNPRFGSAFIFPFAILGACIFQHLTARLNLRQAWSVYALLNAAALACLGAYLLIPRNQFQQRGFNVQGSVDVYGHIRESDQIYPVKDIRADLRDPQVIENNASDLHPAETLFGYTMAQYKPQLHPGPVTDFSDGAYNMTDPTGFVYPEVNGTTAFERIRDVAVLQAFVNRRQPEEWKLPLIQQVLDVLAVLTLILQVGLLGWPVLGRIKSISPPSRREHGETR